MQETSETKLGEARLVACHYCGKRVVSRRKLPESWTLLGGEVACRGCQLVARVTVS